MRLIRDLMAQHTLVKDILVSALSDIDAGKPNKARLKLFRLAEQIDDSMTALPSSFSEDPKGFLPQVRYLLRHRKALFEDWGFYQRITGAALRRGLPLKKGAGYQPTDDANCKKPPKGGTSAQRKRGVLSPPA